MEHLNDEQKRLFEDAFKILNREGDGSITANELAVVMGILGREASEPELQAMINEADLNGNGSMELPEFVWMIKRKLSGPKNQDELREAFRVYDKDNNGYISATELKSMFVYLGVRISNDEVDDLIREADLDEDGVVNFEEFTLMMDPR